MVRRNVLVAEVVIAHGKDHTANSLTVVARDEMTQCGMMFRLRHGHTLVHIDLEDIAQELREVGWKGEEMLSMGHCMNRAMLRIQQRAEVEEDCSRRWMYR